MIVSYALNKYESFSYNDKQTNGPLLIIIPFANLSVKAE